MRDSWLSPFLIVLFVLIVCVAGLRMCPWFTILSQRFYIMQCGSPQADMGIISIDAKKDPPLLHI